jgi:hypothetical protein
VSGALPTMLQEQRAWGQDRPSDFLAASGSSSGKYLKAITGAGFTHGSVSYNQWVTGVQLPAMLIRHARQWVVRVEVAAS